VAAALVSATSYLVPTAISLMLTVAFLWTVRPLWRRHPVYVLLATAPLLVLAVDTFERLCISLAKVAA
jgi:hypothetical protein